MRHGSKGKPELGRRDDGAIDARGAFDLPAVFARDEHLGNEIEFVAGANGATKPGTIDHREKSMHVGLSFETTSGFEKDAGELRKRFDDQRSGHDGVTWKVIGENIVRQRHALDSRGKIRGFESRNSVEEDVTHGAARG